MKLGSQRHGVDDDWVIAFHVKHANLEHRAVSCRPDVHRQVVHDDPSNRVAEGVPDIYLANAVLLSRLADPQRRQPTLSER